MREITVDKDGRATGAVYYDSEGKEQYQAAEMVVMACNAIGTPRILLNSTSAQFPDGLANSSGELGRNLMLHPYATVDGIFDQPVDGAKGPLKCVASHEFYETDLSRGFVRGFSFETQRGYGPVATGLLGVAAGRIPKGRGHHAAYRKLSERMLSLVAVCEDLPEAHNTVTLDPSRCDAHGIPAAKVDYRLSDNSHKMLNFAVARGAEVMRAAGAVDVIETKLLKNAGWHNMGTARMGTDPNTSVVNEWGRCHDVKNLFVIDGSIFVTSAGVNPTRTIQALALYIAEQIKHRLASPHYSTDARNREMTDRIIATDSWYSAHESAVIAAIANAVITADDHHGVPGAGDAPILAKVLARIEPHQVRMRSGIEQLCADSIHWP